MEEDSRRGVRESKKIPSMPLELIIEILLRLPVRSLVRFKRVCKSWLHLLSDPHFAISHSEQASTRTQRLAFIRAGSSQILSIDFNAPLRDDSASAALNLNFLRPNSYHNVQIFGSCRGFLLLNGCQNLWVWNPSTGVHKELPSAPIGSNMMTGVFYAFLYGFGYDSSADDLLVVKASYSPISRKKASTRFEFLSLRANVWTDIDASGSSYMDFSHSITAGSLLNGAIHWLTFSCAKSMNVVLALDLREKSFYDIPLPVHLLENKTEMLGVLGELLCITSVGWNHSTEIWMMKEYGVQSSWTKTIVLSENIDGINEYFFPICYTNGGDIVGTNGSTVLAKCNDKGELQESRSYHNHPYSSQVAVYTESLLTLPM